MLRYFDELEGRERFKRRVVWAFWAFLSGMAVGAILAAAV
jgi:hypothetical protein